MERYAQALLDDKVDWEAAEEAWKPVMTPVPEAEIRSKAGRADLQWGAPCNDGVDGGVREAPARQNRRDCGVRYYRFKTQLGDAEVQALVASLETASDAVKAAAPTAPVDVAGTG